MEHARVCGMIGAQGRSKNNYGNINVNRKASITTIEFLLLCGCEVTAQTLKDGFGYYWFLPCGTRCGPTDSIAELPERVDDYLEDCFGSPADDGENDE